MKPCHVYQVGDGFVRLPVSLAPASSVFVVLLKEGKNQLEIAVTNVWNNRIVGDLQPGGEEPIARTNMKPKFRANSPLVPSGLIGPVKLSFPVTITIPLP